MYWHGFAETWEQFLDHTITDRYLANEELSSMIERANEQGSTQPKDDR